MMPKTLALASLSILILVLSGGPSAAATHGPTVVYEGKLTNADHSNVGGIFPLTFAFHKTATGKHSVWTESHFVTVDGGKYQIKLGKKRAIPSHLKLDKMYLAVAIRDGSEIVREKIDPSSVQNFEQARQANHPVASKKSNEKSVVDYAETAGLSYESEHAKSADRIGNLTEKDLIEELRKTTSSGKLGSTKRYTSSAGGEGGIAYELKCPKGHVVTGVRGGAGLYLDSIQLVCTPLE